VIYAFARGGPFTTLTARYPSWPWLYRVRAVSIKQAYYFAASEVFAPERLALGVWEIRHHNEPAPIWALPALDRAAS